jgi:signal peptidase
MDSVFIISLLGLVYLLINLALPHLPLSPRLTTYLVQPLLWLGVALFIKSRCHSVIRGGLFRRSALLLLSGIFGGVQVIAYMFIGLFSGFGLNPSSDTPLGIALNIFFVGAMLLGMELSRARLLVRAAGKNNILMVLGVSLFFALLNLPVSQVSLLVKHIVPPGMVASLWLPLLAESLLASRLALLGGWQPAIIYRSVLSSFWWFCPILPGLPWFLLGLTGTVLPVLCLMVLEGIISPGTGTPDKKVRRATAAARFGWIAAAALSVMLIWFAVGIFPVKPSVIASGSMTPFMKVGDIAIVARTSPGSIAAGDVIEFRRGDGSMVLHRVVQVCESGGETVFETMGDANNVPDSILVQSQNIEGRVVAVIPKLGWLAVTVRKVLGG